VNSIAARYPTALLRSYARIKIATDPVYNAVFELLRGSTTPLLDVGCGIGILPFYLRERGFTAAITGVDHDKRKIEIAQGVAKSESNLSFHLADARTSFDFRGNVLCALFVFFQFECQGQQGAAIRLQVAAFAEDFLNLLAISTATFFQGIDHE